MSVYANRFAGRAAVVTGGASGLGLCTARRIVAEGGRVALWDINPALLEAAKAEIGADHVVALDVSKHDDVVRAAAQSSAALGKLDILVASAGITGATTALHEFPIDSWQRVVDVNLNGLFYCCREIVPLLLRNGYGRIVNVASVAGKEGNPNASAYSASKAGVIGLTKSLGKELAKYDIAVNCITPATANTRILEGLTREFIDYMLVRIPRGRFLEVDECAAMVAWLVSRENSFTTASTFDLSGGRTTY